MKTQLTLLFSLLFLVISSAQKRYNVLWLVAEDQSSQFFPMYGDTTIDLPALELLAAESIIYDNAFATVPVCAPARSSIILGMYPIKTATHNMRTYNGYRKDNEPSINVPPYTPVMPAGTVEFPKYLRAEDYYCTNNAKEDYNMKVTQGVWDESSNESHWRNKKDGQQFFSIFNFNESHESGIWRFGEDELFVDPDDVFVPPYYPDDPLIRHDLAVNYSNLKRIDDKIGDLIQQLKEDGLYDDTYIFFYGDHGGPLPRHKRSLRDTGLKVPFFVKLPKDMGNDMVRSEEMISFLDLAPTMLSIIGLEKPDNMQGRAFLGQFISAPVDFVFASSDRYDAVYERSRAVRSKRYKYIHNFRPDLPYALPVAYREQMSMMKRLHEMDEAGELKGPAALWMRDSKDPIEFFDLVTDPFELNNLVGNKFYQSEIDKHASALGDWMAENDDQGAIDEQELIKKWKKKKASMSLKAPVVSKTGGDHLVENPNELGNIIYRKKDADLWFPMKAGMKLSDGLVFKIVHIGLDDSAEVVI